MTSRSKKNTYATWTRNVHHHYFKITHHNTLKYAKADYRLVSQLVVWSTSFLRKSDSNTGFSCGWVKISLSECYKDTDGVCPSESDCNSKHFTASFSERNSCCLWKNGVSGKRREKEKMGGETRDLCQCVYDSLSESEKERENCCWTTYLNERETFFTKTFINIQQQHCISSSSLLIRNRTYSLAFTYTDTEFKFYSPRGLWDATAKRPWLEIHPAFHPDDPSAHLPVPTHRACFLGQWLKRQAWGGKNFWEFTDDASLVQWSGDGATSSCKDEKQTHLHN